MSIPCTCTCTRLPSGAFSTPLAGPNACPRHVIDNTKTEMIDRPIFVCAECTFIGGHPEHVDHVEQTDHWTYRTINPNGTVVWTTTAAWRERHPEHAR